MRLQLNHPSYHQGGNLANQQSGDHRLQAHLLHHTYNDELKTQIEKRRARFRSFVNEKAREAVQCHDMQEERAHLEFMANLDKLDRERVQLRSLKPTFGQPLAVPPPKVIYDQDHALEVMVNENWLGSTARPQDEMRNGEEPRAHNEKRPALSELIVNKNELSQSSLLMSKQLTEKMKKIRHYRNMYGRHHSFVENLSDFQTADPISKNGAQVLTAQQNAQLVEQIRNKWIFNGRKQKRTNNSTPNGTIQANHIPYEPSFVKKGSGKKTGMEASDILGDLEKAYRICGDEICNNSINSSSWPQDPSGMPMKLGQSRTKGKGQKRATIELKDQSSNLKKYSGTPKLNAQPSKRIKDEMESWEDKLKRRLELSKCTFIDSCYRNTNHQILHLRNTFQKQEAERKEIMWKIMEFAQHTKMAKKRGRRNSDFI